MPNLPISQLPQSSTLQGDELFVDVQGGVTKYTELDAIKNYVTGSIDTYTQNNSFNSYLVPVNLTVEATVNQYLTGSEFANTAMIHIDWTGSNGGTMDLFLPDATAPININRSIRFITDNTFSTNTRCELKPLPGQTLDNGTTSYTINKAYEGIMVWSDGIEWYRVQTKA